MEVPSRERPAIERRHKGKRGASGSAQVLLRPLRHCLALSRLPCARAWRVELARVEREGEGVRVSSQRAGGSAWRARLTYAVRQSLVSSPQPASVQESVVLGGQRLKASCDEKRLTKLASGRFPVV